MADSKPPHIFHGSAGLAADRLGATRHARLALQQPVLVDAQIALGEQRLDDAEKSIALYEQKHGRDAAALMLRAAVPARSGRPAEAIPLLREALALAPDLTEAQLVLASVLSSLSLVEEALAVLDEVLRREPHNADAGRQRIWGLANTGRYEAARTACEALLKTRKDDPYLWLSYGHFLKASVPGGAASAYRRAAALAPGWGEAWWALANLKTERLSAADVQAMRTALQAPGNAPENRIPLLFALAKALEDDGHHEEAFRYYAQGNQERRDSFSPQPVPIAAEVESAIAVTTPDFFTARANQGCPAEDPIFIVGMPRAGTTLIEQILASHSAIEGTAELLHISNIVQELIVEHGLSGPNAYAEMLARLDPARLGAIGADYLRRAQAHRHSDKPYFIDKMPSNWRYIALIRLILPRARIIDIRRDAMDCCFANYRQLFGGGHEFAYSLSDLGAHYRNYAKAIDHAAAVMDDGVIPVSYESLIDAPEPEIRGLLTRLGLPFESACVSFHKNGRAVSTPSAEQVRRPINSDGVGRWRPYERWLEPLMTALGTKPRSPDSLASRAGQSQSRGMTQASVDETGLYLRDGYVALEGLFPPEVLAAFYQRMQADLQAAGKPMTNFMQQGRLLRQPAIEIYAYQYPPMLTFLWGLTPRIAMATKRDLLPTYAYFRAYQKGDICRIHSDRQACEHSLSLTVAYGENLVWPLSVGTERLDQPQSMVTDDFAGAPYGSVAMRPGDGVLYQGTHHRHGRLDPNPNSWSAHLFLHWIDRNGPYKAEAFDRPTMERASRARA